MKTYLFLIHFIAFFSLSAGAEDRAFCPKNDEALGPSVKMIVEISKDIGVGNALSLKDYSQCTRGIIKALIEENNWSSQEIYELCTPRSNYCRVSPVDGCYIGKGQALLNTKCFCINKHNSRKIYGKIGFSEKLFSKKGPL